MRKFIRRPMCVTAAVAALTLSLAACNSNVAGSNGADSTGNVKAGDPLKIAVLLASSQNGYNQAIYEGAKAEAEKIGDVSVTIFDGQFDSQTQFNQLQNVAAQGKFDGILVVPNDNVGLAAAVPAAQQAGIPVVAVHTPIGSNLTDLNPQEPGVVATVGVDVEAEAKAQAEGVVDYCEDKDPCDVVVLIGQLQYPFDNLRYEAYKQVLGEHDNINIVATGQGNYDRDTSLKAMQNILQAHPDFDVLLSNSDQHVIGAQIALEAANVDVKDLYISGGGGSTQGIEQMREGNWDANSVLFPNEMGAAAIEQVTNAAWGKPVEKAINIGEVGPVPFLVTPEVLQEHPDYVGEWSA